MQGFPIPADLIFLLIPEADSPHADSNLSDRNCLICVSLTSFRPLRYTTTRRGPEKVSGGKMGKWQMGLW
jgi:hypothetical protein